MVSGVDDPCVIQTMPEFARGVAVAYCDAPGPLERASVPTFYCIAPTPAGWPAERVESFYREYNDHGRSGNHGRSWNHSRSGNHRGSKHDGGPRHHRGRQPARAVR